MKITALALTAALVFATASQAQESGAAVRARKAEQQNRIANGVASGQLTGHEAKHLEHQERAINRETRAMRAQNGGRLSPADRALVQRQQNQESRKIYAQKHDGQVR